MGFRGARGLRLAVQGRGNVRNVLYCSMGSEQYETLIGLGFAGYLFILFYCSILLQIKPTNSEWKPLHYA